MEGKWGKKKGEGKTAEKSTCEKETTKTVNSGSGCDVRGDAWQPRTRSFNVALPVKVVVVVVVVQEPVGTT